MSSVLYAEEPSSPGGEDSAEEHRSKNEQPAAGEEGLTEGGEADADPSLIDSMKSLIPQVHGFVSQGFMLSSGNNYLANTKEGTFEFSEVGLNFTTQVSDKFRIGMQLFMRDLGPIGNYKPQFDWYYLDYRFFEWLGLRAGRTKIPFGLYNEVNDVDAARVPVLLPQSLYPAQNRDFLLAQTGVELYGDVPLGAAGSIGYNAYGGTIYLDVSSATAVENFNVPYVVGGRVTWHSPLSGLQVGGTLQALSLDGDNVLDPGTLQRLQDEGILPSDSDGRVPFRIPAVLWVASLEYAAHGLQLSAEYGRWYTTIESDVPDVIPTIKNVSERFYVMGSYRINDWFSPGAYYSFLLPNVDERQGYENKQHDLATTLRIDLNDYWLVKLEGHYMRGTADVDERLNDGTPKSELPRDWGLFLAKTTAYF